MVGMLRSKKPSNKLSRSLNWYWYWSNADTFKGPAVSAVVAAPNWCGVGGSGVGGVMVCACVENGADPGVALTVWPW